MLEPAIVSAIGWAAGAMNLSSSFPQLIANLRNSELAAKQSPTRNLMQACGNGLWLIYACVLGASEMIVFAALGAALAMWLFIQCRTAVSTVQIENVFSGGRSGG